MKEKEPIPVREHLEFDQVNRELLAFLDASPTSFHAVANMGDMLEAAGCTRLEEGQPWSQEPGRGY